MVDITLTKNLELWVRTESTFERKAISSWFPASLQDTYHIDRTDDVALDYIQHNFRSSFSNFLRQNNSALQPFESIIKKILSGEELTREEKARLGGLRAQLQISFSSGTALLNSMRQRSLIQLCSFLLGSGSF
jgi:hypothetical protein